jgi:hypothetical protein
VSPALAEPAVRHEAAHVARRAAAYVPSLMRFAPERKLPGDSGAAPRDVFRRVRQAIHELTRET